MKSSRRGDHNDILAGHQYGDSFPSKYNVKGMKKKSKAIKKGLAQKEKPDQEGKKNVINLKNQKSILGEIEKKDLTPPSKRKQIYLPNIDTINNSSLNNSLEKNKN